MSKRNASDARGRPARRPHRALSALTILVALVFAGSIVAVSLAASTTLTVGSTTSSALGEKVAVNPQGRTLYALSPETIHHLLCRSKECLQVWPPLTVRSRSAKFKLAAGISGKLGLIARGNGVFQLTLRGKPLYRFSGDGGKGEDNGEGLKSFGGTWHAVTAAATPTTTAAPASVPSEPEYKYSYQLEVQP